MLICEKHDKLICRTALKNVGRFDPGSLCDFIRNDKEIPKKIYVEKSSFDVPGQNCAKMVGNYCASKAAVTMLAKTLALEEAAHKVRVNVVSPGAVFSEMSMGVFQGMRCGLFNSLENPQTQQIAYVDFC